MICTGLSIQGIALKTTFNDFDKNKEYVKKFIGNTAQILGLSDEILCFTIENNERSSIKYDVYDTKVKDNLIICNSFWYFREENLVLWIQLSYLLIIKCVKLTQQWSMI